jgi:hypothetical protein
MGIGRESNVETIAYTPMGMRHPWNRQAPRLFAETTEAWIENIRNYLRALYNFDAQAPFGIINLGM